MPKIQISMSASVTSDKPLPTKDWFTKDVYAELAGLARYVLTTRPDTTPRSVCKDILSGKYTSAKELKADVKILIDYAKVIANNLRQRAGEDLSL